MTYAAIQVFQTQLYRTLHRLKKLQEGWTYRQEDRGTNEVGVDGLITGLVNPPEELGGAGPPLACPAPALGWVHTAAWYRGTAGLLRYTRL